MLRQLTIEDAPEYNSFRNDPSMQEWQLEDGQISMNFNYSWELASPLHIVFGGFLDGKLRAIFKFEYRGTCHVDCYVSVVRGVRGKIAVEWAKEVHKILLFTLQKPYLIVSALVAECHKGSRAFCIANGFKLSGVIPNSFVKNNHYWCKMIYVLELK